jgi:hypothetical protein
VCAGLLCSPADLPGYAAEKAKLVPDLEIMEALQNSGDNVEMAFAKLEEALARKYLPSHARCLTSAFSSCYRRLVELTEAPQAPSGTCNPRKARKNQREAKAIRYYQIACMASASPGLPHALGTKGLMLLAPQDQAAGRGGDAGGSHGRGASSGRGQSWCGTRLL